MTEKLYPLSAAAKERLGGISYWYLIKAIREGLIKPTRLGRRVFLSEAECQRLIRDGLPSLGREPVRG
jgi:hypothetical protein